MRQTLRRLLAASSEWTKGPRGAVDVRSQLGSLQAQLAAHFEKEEAVLFWLAELKL